METGEFHWCHGIYFKRTADGAVRLRIEKGDEFGNAYPILVVIPSNEWASIVSWVSSKGEAAGDETARTFHNG